MNLTNAIILGTLQGITEFLPVSSSGHLAVSQHLLGYNPAENMLFDVILHLGTLAAVIVIYRESLFNYVKSFFNLFRESDNSFMEKLKGDAHFVEIYYIILATIPTGLIGVFFHKDFERLFGSLQMIAYMFAITGFLLLITHWRSSGTIQIKELKWHTALLIGLGQGLAITPGISRSGTTIAIALLLGMRRDEAARFSFLLSIPAILGATLLELRKLHEIEVNVLAFLSGGFVAMVTGLLALIFLIKIVKKGQLAWFSPYLWALSAIILLHIHHIF